MSDLSDFDVGALAAVLISLAVYHSIFYMIYSRSSKDLFSTSLSDLNLWVEKHDFKNEAPQVTCAVHTLRNTIYAAIFVGTNSFQFGFYYMNSPSYSLKDQVRSVILSALLFSSFLCWATTIRNANNLAYMIGAFEYQMKEVIETIKERKNEILIIKKNTKQSLDLEIGGQEKHLNNYNSEFPTGIIRVDNTADKNHEELKLIIDDPKILYQEALKSEEIVHILAHHKKTINSMQISFSMGFRFLFVMIPFIFFIAGPLPFILAAVVIFAFLIKIDYFEV